MKLSGDQFEQICDALLSGYPKRDDLRAMVRIKLDKELDAISSGENQSSVIFNLVTWAEANGCVDALIDGAYNRNSGNPALQQMRADWDTQAETRQQSTPARSAITASPPSAAASKGVASPDVGTAPSPASTRKEGAQRWAYWTLLLGAVAVLVALAVLLSVIYHREPAAGAVREIKGVPFVYVPAGKFKMGSDPVRDQNATPDEKPQHTVMLPGFWIQRTEVTNEQYKRCVDANACTPPGNSRWNDPSYAIHPVTNVDWNQVNAYAKWFGGRLPTEAEWEKGCRGTDDRTYPWGIQPPDSSRANYANDNGTEPVGSYLAGASPYGALDMAGNVWEWTSSAYMDYPYRADDGREAPTKDSRVLRGGSYISQAEDTRCALRLRYYPSDWYDLGFRVVVSPSTAEP